MITSWDIYLISRLDAISKTLESVSILGFVVVLLSAAVIFMFWSEMESDQRKHASRWFPVVVAFWLFCLVANTLIPTTKQAVAIYMAPAIINNETVRDIPGNAATLFNEQLKAWIKEVSEPEKK